MPNWCRGLPWIHPGEAIETEHMVMAAAGRRIRDSVRGVLRKGRRLIARGRAFTAVPSPLPKDADRVGSGSGAMPSGSAVNFRVSRRGSGSRSGGVLDRIFHVWLHTLQHIEVEVRT